jgi:hypothetical protein
LPPTQQIKNIKSTSKKNKLTKSENVAHHVHLPNDILYEIMLNSDISTVHQYCLTNKSALQLCQNSQFWKQKFNDDQLPYCMKCQKKM